VTRRALLIWALLAAMAAGLSYALLSEAFLAWAWQRAAPALPPGISVASVEGRLAGPITLRGVRVNTAGHRARVDELRVDWRPWHLFLATLTLDEVTVRGATYTGPAASPAAESASDEGFQLPERLQTPLFFHIRRLDLRAIRLQANPQAPVTPIERLTGRLGFGADGPYWRELELTLPALTVRSQGQVARRAPNGLDARLDWQWQGPNGLTYRGKGRLRGDRQRLHLRHRLTAPWPVTAEGRVTDPLGELAWRLQVDGEELAARALAPAGPAVTADVHLTARGDLEQAEGEVRTTAHVPEQPTVAARTSFRLHLPQRRLALREGQLSPRGHPATLSVAGEARLTDAGPRFDLQGTWQELAWPLDEAPLVRSRSGDWALSGAPDDLRARFHGDLNGQTQLHGAGSWRRGTAALAVRWTDLRWPGRPDLPTSPAGFVSASGRPEAYRVHVRGALQARPELPLQVRLHGQGDTAGLQLEELALHGLDGRLRARGDLAWAPQPAWDLTLTGQGIDPGGLLAQWPGRIGVRAATTGELTADGLRLQLPRLAAQGQLRGRPLDLHLRGDYRDGAVTDAHLALGLGDSRLTAQGAVGDTADLQWQLDSPDLADFHPHAAGALSGSGEISGALPRPRVRLDLSGQDLAWGDLAAGQLDLDSRLDPSGEQASALTLDVARARVGTTAVSRLHVRGTGTPGRHRVHGAAETAWGDGAWDVQGQLTGDEPRWAFRLTQLKLDPVDLAPWELERPATGVVAPGRQQLDSACLASAEGRLCLEGSRSAEALRARFQAARLPLGYFRPLLPPGTELVGEISGGGHLSRTGQDPFTGEFNLETSRGHLAHRENGEVLGEIAFGPSQVQARATPETLRGEGHLDLAGSDGLHTRWTVQRQETLAAAPLSGHLRGRLTNLGFIPALFPEVSALEGALELDVTAAGTVGAPAWDGGIRFTAKRIGQATPGITLRDARLTLAPAQEETLSLTGSARSEDGRLELAGRAGPGRERAWVEATLQGEDFLAYNTRDARIHLSPDLSLALRGRRVELNGTVRIPRAEITPTDLGGKGAVRVSGDQVIVRPGTPEEEAEPWRVVSEIQLLMGERVRFDGFGLRGRIEGGLTLREEPGKPTTGTGEVRLAEGRYRAFGQNLRIETGRLLFGGGPLTDPGLDVRAIRQPRLDITVGVHARGPLREPEFTLFSEPAMPQAEQLSWLVLGRPLETASEGENNAMNRAALMLGLKGAQVLNRTIGSEAGLDTLAVETEPTETGEQASLVLGKYLSPRLYVSYGIGLFEPVNTFRVTYSLTRHWELITESSTLQSSGDIFYTIESGK